MVTPDYSMLSEFGIENYTFKYRSDGSVERIPVNSATVGVDNNFVIQSLAMLWTDGSILPRFERKQREDDLIAIRDRGKVLGYPEGFTLKSDFYVDAWENNKWPFLQDIDVVMAFPTSKEADRIAALLPNLGTYSMELASSLVMGQKSLDNWDSYMSELKRLGLDELIGIYQARIDRARL
jgi:hypothetical protein